MKSWFLGSALWFAILAVSTHSARADWSFDLYGGAGFTHDHDAQVALPDIGITGVHRSLEFDTAALIGGRFAYWSSPTALFGFAFDVSHFFGLDQPEQLSDTELFANGTPVSEGPELIRRFEISVTSLAFDVLYFRLPIAVSADFPGGRLQPYVTAGPAVFIASMTDTSNFLPAGQVSTSTSVGAQVGGGVHWLLTQNAGFFIEYRYSAFQLYDRFANEKIVHGMRIGRTDGSATFNIDSVVAGMTFRF
jgi:opacity protein-like surface antigen